MMGAIFWGLVFFFGPLRLEPVHPYSVLVAEGTGKEGNEAGDPTIRKNRETLHQPSAFPLNSLLPAPVKSISFEKGKLIFARGLATYQLIAQFN